MATGIQISAPSDITIGTTPISSGTEGRILFQGAGNVVQQDSGLFWDNTNKRFQVSGLTSSIIRNTSGTRTIQLENYSADVNYLSSTGAALRIKTTDANFINFQTNNTTRAHITDTGNLRIINSVQIGANVDPSVRLDVRAQGALSTDIIFRTRNSSDTRNFLTVNGAGDVFNNGAGGVASNTFYGENSGRASTGSDNSFYGLSAGQSNTSGINNSFFGRSSGVNNTTGNFNSFFGRFSGNANSTGFQNTFTGNSSGQANTTADSNSFYGSNTGESNTTGRGNSFYGQGSGQYATTGNFNSFFGRFSGRLISSGANLTIANNSLFLGYDTRANADNETNQIVIGHEAIGLGSNTSVIGNSSTTRWKLWGVGLLENITAPSTSVTDNFHFYSADITAGNAAPHFRTEAGDVIKLYKETTAVGGAGYVDGIDDPIRKDTTMNGYTVEQVVKALQNLGILA